jgi:hypothetical protein
MTTETLFTPAQENRFKSLCKRVHTKELTPNQAYKFAQADEGEDNRGFVGTFKEWMVTAQKNQWLADLINPPAPEPAPKKENNLLPVLGAVAIGLVAIVIVTKVLKTNKNK